MRTELWCLVAVAIWGVALTMIEVTGKTRIAGPAWNAGNRAEQKEFPEWIQRAGRALGNHKENFPLFATAVIVVHLAGRYDSVSAMAAIAFVIARVLHGLIYLAGIVAIRTAAFLAGLVSCFVILSRLL